MFVHSTSYVFSVLELALNFLVRVLCMPSVVFGALITLLIVFFRTLGFYKVK